MNPEQARAYLIEQGRAAARERDEASSRLYRLKQDYDKADYTHELAKRRASAYRNALLEEGYTYADLNALGIPV